MGGGECRCQVVAQEAGVAGLREAELEEGTAEEQLWQERSPAMEVGGDLVTAMVCADTAEGKGGGGVFLQRRIRRGGAGGDGSIAGCIGSGVGVGAAFLSLTRTFEHVVCG